MMSSDQRDRIRDKYFLFAAIIGFGFWLASIGSLRTWATGAGLRGSFVLGVAPSFFAGWTFAFWQAFAVRNRPLASALYAASLVTAAEVVQLFVPRYTADVWDAVAGIAGAAVALPILLRRERQRRRNQLRLEPDETSDNSPRANSG